MTASYSTTKLRNGVVTKSCYPEAMSYIIACSRDL